MVFWERIRKRLANAIAYVHDHLTNRILRTAKKLKITRRLFRICYSEQYSRVMSCDDLVKTIKHQAYSSFCLSLTICESAVIEILSEKNKIIATLS